MEEVIKRVLDGYGLAEYSLLPVQKGYRNQSFPVRLNDGSMLNLILYKCESGMLERIKCANAVADYVHDHGLLARHTCSPKIARLKLGSREKYGALYMYLPGRTIPWEAYTMKHLKLLGKTMSDLHAALQSFDSSWLPDVVDEYSAIAQRMHRYFASAGVQRGLAAKLRLEVPVSTLNQIDNTLAACRHLPSKQALHMDFVRGNILFDDTANGLAITGILDFEKTACGSPLFDVARTLAFLLIDCKYKQPDKIRKYFMQSGYQKRGGAGFRNVIIKTKTGDIDILEGLLDTFLTYDFYKFLRHNPYEYLLRNEHFVRTRDTLLDRRLLVSQVV